MSAVMGGSSFGSDERRAVRSHAVVMDYPLLAATMALLLLGLVMVFSSSITIADRQMGQPLYYFLRQFAFVVVGLYLAWLTTRLPLQRCEEAGPMMLLVGMALLVMVLIPGVGKEVNGSMRWIGIGPARLQPSELAKLFMIIYMAGFMVRRGDELRNSMAGFLKPMGLLVVISFLLLLEPDFGAATVLTASVMGMMFVGGVRLWKFGALIAAVVGAAVVLVATAPYRMARVTSFLNPWEDPFNSGFQLTQALIAFGRGEWFGVGLGGSVQKLFYLPEAHTDFLLAVLAEELGLVGVCAVILLFGVIVWRSFVIGRAAEQAGQYFGAYLAFGLGIWVSMQAFVNIGVNMGVLPTKGLTLPLMSYGGSSIVVMCIVIALIQRVNHETQSAAGNNNQPRKRAYR